MKKYLLLIVNIIVIFTTINVSAITLNYVYYDLPPVPPTPPPDVNVSCAGNVPPKIDLTATDDIDGEITVSPTQQYIPEGCPNHFTLIRIWTFTDSGGNTSSVSQTITVEDNEPPVIISELPQDLNLDCASEIPASEELTATDNCGQSWTKKPVVKYTPEGCPNHFTLVRTWTFRDTCRNETTHIQTITVEDNEPPVIQGPLPQDLTLVCASEIPAAAELTATDNCGQRWTKKPVVKYTPEGCPNHFTLVRTWTFRDTCSNETTHTQTITVEDNEPPVIQGPLPQDLTLVCASEIPAAAELTATDNCGQRWTKKPVVKYTPEGCPNHFTLVRTWTFRDTCSNETTHTQTITVEDNEPPVIQGPLPQDLTLVCASEIPAAAELTATDNCGQSWTKKPVVRYIQEGCPNHFTLVRTWTFKDTCNNISSHTQTIIVEDNEPPVIQGPLPEDLNLESASEIPAAAELTATDNCGQSWTKKPKVEYLEGCPNNITLVRTWTFRDTCNNVSSHIQTITVDAEDNEPPVIQGSLPQDLTLVCASEIPAAAELTAIDDIDGEITVSPTDHYYPGGCPNSFTLIRTWSFTNSSGNTSSVCQTIIVKDNEPPVIQGSLPQDLTFECASEIPAAEELTATDNCGKSWTKKPKVEYYPGGCPNNFTLVRTWTFRDTCRNETTHIQTITVEDNEPPVIQGPLPQDLTLECATKIPAAEELTATDNCGKSWTKKPKVEYYPGGCPNNFTLVRTWTFRDTCRNETTHIQTITVEDNEPPVIQGPLPQDLTLECATKIPEAEELTATDNCGKSWTKKPKVEYYPGGCPNNFTLVRTWTYRDTCRNETTHIQTITVEDNEPPVIQGPLPQDLTLECATKIPEAEELTATDNCGKSWTKKPKVEYYPGGCPNNFTLVRTWTYRDTCRNEITHIQTITVKDYEPPVFENPPSDLNLECDSEIPPAENLVATDNCHRDQTIVPKEEIIPGDCVNEFTIIRTWTATDTCGNTGSYTQTIEVGDKTPPEIICPADITVSCNEIPSILDEGYFATAKDNCDENVDILFDEIREDFCGEGYYLLKRSWTAVDDCGNESSCEQVIKVITDVETDCWILRLLSVNYSAVGDATTYTWKLFGKEGKECKYALSNIKFEIFEAMNVLNPEDKSLYILPVNFGSYLVENPSNAKSKKSNLYGIKFDGIGEGISEGGPETFIYSLPGKSVMLNVKVEIKAGREMQTADVSIRCSCFYNNLKSQEIKLEKPVTNKFNFKIYPNPFDKRLNFEFISPESTEVNIDIYDVTGRKVECIFNDMVMEDVKYNAEFVPVSTITGFYFYRITTQEFVYTGKVIYMK